MVLGMDILTSLNSTKDFKLSKRYLDIKAQFKKEVKGLKDYIALVTVNPKDYQKSNVEVLRLLVNEQKTPGVYVTLNKPYDIMQRLLAENRYFLKPPEF